MLAEETFSPFQSWEDKGGWIDKPDGQSEKDSNIRKREWGCNEEKLYDMRLTTFHQQKALFLLQEWDRLI